MRTKFQQLALMLVAVLLLSSLGCSTNNQDVGVQASVSLEPPSALLSRLPTDVEEPRLGLQGSDYSDLLPNHAVEPVENQFALFAGANGGQSDERPLAVYEFQSDEPPAEPFLRLLWETPQQSVADMRFAVANVAGDRWDWLPLSADNMIHLEPLEDYRTDDGRTLLAVVNTGARSAWLRAVRLGLTPVDRLYMVPEKTECRPGERVRVAVHCEGTASPLFYSNFEVRYGAQASYVPHSFELGEQNAGGWEVDGMWTATGVRVFWPVPDVWLEHPIDSGNALRVALVPSPDAGTWSEARDVMNATAELFSFELEVTGDTALGFAPGRSYLHTAYEDLRQRQHSWWWDDSNQGQPIIRCRAAE